MNSDKKIFWKCRRGMLELDLILQQFFQKNWSNLSSEEQAVFAELLDEHDPILAAWIFGLVQCTKPHYEKLLKKIKQLNPEISSLV
jgi:antitoxin CptB